MAFANLGELKTVINDTLNRDDLTAQIPNFIKMNEESVNRKVNVSEMEEYTEFTINVGQTTLPTNFLEMRNIQMKSSEYPLQYVPHNSLDGIGADSGIPRFYSIQGTKLLFYPFPPDATIGIMRYLAEVTPLVNDVDTNCHSEEGRTYFVHWSRKLMDPAKGMLLLWAKMVMMMIQKRVVKVPVDIRPVAFAMASRKSFHKAMRLILAGNSVPWAATRSPRKVNKQPTV